MLNSKNTLGKTLIRSYDYSDIFTNRNDSETVVVNGRTYIKYGTRTAFTAVGFLYEKATDVEPLKYFLCIGTARQAVMGYNIKEDAAEELAAVNAQINPDITIELSSIPTPEDFDALCILYSKNFLKKKFLLTPEEIHIGREDGE